MENGLINEKLIIKAWAFLREKEMSIPDETLDFMRDAALEKLKLIEDNKSDLLAGYINSNSNITSNSITNKNQYGTT